jgi:Domain of unknown function (DUF1996)
MKNQHRALQYGIRALLMLVVLLPVTLFADGLTGGSKTVTENGPSTTVSPAPEQTEAPLLTLPPGSVLDTVPGDATGAASRVLNPPATTAGQGQLAGAPAGRPGIGTSGMFDAIRNKQDKFGRYANLPSNQLDKNALTIAAGRPDNGSNGEGQFRVACEYSHFNYDDPIVFPGQPGKSHLHMFIGNTQTDAFTTADSLLNTGGGTCDGFELNRSAYWVPALLDGQGHAVAPKSIIIYYKTKDMANATFMPQGLKMVAGNIQAETFAPDQNLHWACGGSGASYNESNRIPNCGGDIINATIVFPNCWDGANLDSADHASHLAYADGTVPCPASHPKRLPQISILVYWDGVSSVNGWYLSSDKTSGFNSGPGASLHGDWWGGWNQSITELWTNGCIKPARNCSFGQTGTDRQLAPLNDLQEYNGPALLPLPPGAGPGLE